jgi:hypothetical protein
MGRITVEIIKSETKNHPYLSVQCEDTEREEAIVALNRCIYALLRDYDDAIKET